VVISRIGPLAGDFAESGGIGQPALVNGSKGGSPKRDGATPSAVSRGIAPGVIDRGTAANGVGPLDELRYAEVKTGGDWYYYLRQAGLN
jgi:hypothetical protein